MAAEYNKKTIQKLFKENHVDNKELSEALEMPIQSVWRKTRLGLWTVAEMEQIAEMKNSKLQIDFISNEQNLSICSGKNGMSIRIHHNILS